MHFIHPTGKYPILMSLGISVIILAMAFAFFYFSVPAFFYILLVGILILNIWVIAFFRNPKRPVTPNDHLILAPADGVVVAIEQVFEKEFFNEKKQQISIFMSPFNVHFNTIPLSGSVSYKKHHRGRYLVAWNPKSSTLNERTTVVIENINATIMVRQIAGYIARRIINHVHVGDTVKQGDELGFIKFGSRVDLFLPVDLKINISLGDITTANRTVIAKI